METTKDCPNCNKSINLIFEDSYFASCPHCFSVVSIKAAREEKAILGNNKRESYPERRYLRIGQTFTYQDITYTITGRAVIRAKYTLPLEKENNTGVANYHEWFCRSKSDEYLTITENSIGFTISRPEKPDADVDELFSGNFMRVSSSIDFRPIAEQGDGKVIYFEGEADDNYYPGRKLCYATYQHMGYTYGAEWNPEKKEVSVAYFVQTTLPEVSMFKMINDANDLTEYNNKLKEYNFFRGSLIATTSILFLLMLITIGHKGKVIYDYSVNLKDIPETGVKATPFTISSLNEAYAIKVTSFLGSGNTEVLAAVEVNNENGNAIYLLEKWFWTASGGSGSDRWSEKDISLTDYFKPEVAGEYTPVIFIEKSKLSRIYPNDRITISVAKGMYLIRYFAVLFIIFIIGLIIIYNPVSGHFVKAWYFKLLNK